MFFARRCFFNRIILFGGKNASNIAVILVSRTGFEQLQRKRGNVFSVCGYFLKLAVVGVIWDYVGIFPPSLILQKNWYSHSWSRPPVLSPACMNSESLFPHNKAMTWTIELLHKVWDCRDSWPLHSHGWRKICVDSKGWSENKIFFSWTMSKLWNLFLFCIIIEPRPFKLQFHKKN